LSLEIYLDVLVIYML